MSGFYFIESPIRAIFSGKFPFLIPLEWRFEHRDELKAMFKLRAPGLDYAGTYTGKILLTYQSWSHVWVLEEEELKKGGK